MEEPNSGGKTDAVEADMTDALDLRRTLLDRGSTERDLRTDRTTDEELAYAEHVVRAFRADTIKYVFFSSDATELHVETDRFAAVGHLDVRKDVPIVMDAVLKHKESGIEFETDNTVVCEILSEAPRAREKYRRKQIERPVS